MNARAAGGLPHFTERNHRHGHRVALHSCGAIADVIERLIESGVDCLHPLQALAKGHARGTCLTP